MDFVERKGELFGFIPGQEILLITELCNMTKQIEFIPKELRKYFDLVKPFFSNLCMSPMLGRDLDFARLNTIENFEVWIDRLDVLRTRLKMHNELYQLLGDSVLKYSAKKFCTFVYPVDLLKQSFSEWKEEDIPTISSYLIRKASYNALCRLVDSETSNWEDALTVKKPRICMQLKEKCQIDPFEETESEKHLILNDPNYDGQIVYLKRLLDIKDTIQRKQVVCACIRQFRWDPQISRHSNVENDDSIAFSLFFLH